MKIKVRASAQEDLMAIAEIYRNCFFREKYHSEWINANFLAFPRMLYYVAIQDNQILGYALWSVKSGFRDKSVVELEQLAVIPETRGQGVGRFLLEQSFSQFTQHLNEREVTVKAIYLTTRAGNNAESLYQKVFGIERAAIIKNYGSGDEVILFKQYP